MLLPYHYKALNMNEIIHVINVSCYCRLGVAENNQPYVMPMFFSYTENNGQLTFQMLSLDSGKKMNCLENNAQVCIEFDLSTSHGVKSVIAFGHATLINHHALDDSNTTVIINVEVDQITGRLYYC